MLALESAGELDVVDPPAVVLSIEAPSWIAALRVDPQRRVEHPGAADPTDADALPHEGRQVEFRLDPDTRSRGIQGPGTGAAPGRRGHGPGDAAAVRPGALRDAHRLVDASRRGRRGAGVG